ncbi:MAG: undecaprenyl diphosphate synthase family protein [Chloroflexota bacterium]
MRLPNHVGVIPDGNRRWAQARGLAKGKGYTQGLDPALAFFKLARAAGIRELSVYGFTIDNNKRPPAQRKAFTDACIRAVDLLSREDAELLVVGNADSRMFPKELLPYTSERTTFGAGGTKVNFLVNYGWEWDLNRLKSADPTLTNIMKHLRSSEVSKIDLIIRWGGRSRLSGFLPVQSVYADIYVVDEFWPDFKPEHLSAALEWYDRQDITLGG